MDIEESFLVLAGGKGRKRRRDSTSSVPSCAKKSKVDETEGQRPASAPPYVVGYETDSEKGEGVLYLEEYREQVMQHVDDPMPHHDVGSFSDDVHYWTPGMMMFDMDVEPEDIQSISSDGTYWEDDEMDDVEFILDSENY